MSLSVSAILGIVGAALAAGGTAGGMAMTGKLNKKNREFQHNEAEIARNFQAKQALESFNRQAEFYETTSSPAAQVRQYEQAGLNPALMYEGKMMSPQMPSPAVGSAPMAGAPSTHGFPADIMSGVLSAAKIGSEIKLMDSEANKNNADAGLSIQKIQESIKSMDVMDAKVDDLRASVQERMQNILESDATIEEKQATVSMLIQKTEYLKAESERSRAIIDEVAASIRNLDADTELQKQMFASVGQDIIRKQIENASLPEQIQKEFKRIDSELNLLDEEAANVSADTELKQNQSANVEADTALKEQQTKTEFEETQKVHQETFYYQTKWKFDEHLMTADMAERLKPNTVKAMKLWNGFVTSLVSAGVTKGIK